MEIDFNELASDLGVDLNEHKKTKTVKPSEHKKTNDVFDKFIKLTNDEIKTVDISYNNAQKLAEDIDIHPGDCIYVNLAGKFVFGDFIGAFIIENNLDVEEMTIISLSGAIPIYEMFDLLIKNGWVKKINLILSTYYIKMDQKYNPKAIAMLNDMVDYHKGNFNVYHNRIHTKLVLIKTIKGGHVTMHGSANLRNARCLEQLIIQENKNLYDFNYNYYKSLIPEENG